MSRSHNKNLPPFKFLCDENIDVRLSSFLKSEGYLVEFVPKGIKNGKVFNLAKERRRILITNDKDFANPEIYSPEKMAGIVILNIHPPLLSKQIAALKKLLEMISSKGLSGKIYILSESGVECIK